MLQSSTENLQSLSPPRSKVAASANDDPSMATSALCFSLQNFLKASIRVVLSTIFCAAGGADSRAVSSTISRKKIVQMNVDFSNEIALVGLQYVPERFHHMQCRN